MKTPDVVKKTGDVLDLFLHVLGTRESFTWNGGICRLERGKIKEIQPARTNKFAKMQELLSLGGYDLVTYDQIAETMVVRKKGRKTKYLAREVEGAFFMEPAPRSRTKKEKTVTETKRDAPAVEKEPEKTPEKPKENGTEYSCSKECQFNDGGSCRYDILEGGNTTCEDPLVETGRF